MKYRRHKMKISTKGRYALRVMIDLALNSNENFIALKEIAKRQDITVKYLEQIVALLNKAGFLETARGNSGGYKLAKEPKDYIVGDILRATEGDLAPIICLTEDGVCQRKQMCKTYSFWKGLDDVINDYIDSKTLEDLLK
jgi:Rrf2 family protein